MRDAARATCCCAVHVALIPLALRWRAHVSHLSCCCAVHVARSLLPRLNDYDLKYLQFRVRSKGLNVLSAHAVSARSGRGVDRLADDVLAHCAGDARSCCRARCCGTCCCWGAGRDVFVCGAANVGKSTLVKSLVAQVTLTFTRTYFWSLPYLLGLTLLAQEVTWPRGADLREGKIPRIVRRQASREARALPGDKLTS